MTPDEFKPFSAMLARIVAALDQPAKPSAYFEVAFEALRPYPLRLISEALSAHLRDPQRGRFVPVAADVIAQINALAERDGRPGPQEAWAMIPTDEAASVIWSEEMAAAFGVAAPLLRAGDAIAARMAFLEAYRSRVADARSRGVAPRWSASYGTDVAGRAVAIEHASNMGRISREQTTAMLAIAAPHREPSPVALRLLTPITQGSRHER